MKPLAEETWKRITALLRTLDDVLENNPVTINVEAAARMLGLQPADLQQYGRERNEQPLNHYGYDDGDVAITTYTTIHYDSTARTIELRTVTETEHHREVH
jgi:hypothetical protein